VVTSISTAKSNLEEIRKSVPHIKWEKLTERAVEDVRRIAKTAGVQTVVGCGCCRVVSVFCVVVIGVVFVICSVVITAVLIILHHCIVNNTHPTQQ